MEKTKLNPEEKALELFSDMMIAKIQSISENWKKPWFTEGLASWPRNISGREYNGMNSFMLMMLCEEKGYKNPLFLTFDRCVSLNYVKDDKGNRYQLKDEQGNALPTVHVMKGEKSFPVFFTTFTCIHDVTKERIKYDDYKQLSENERKFYNVFPKTQTYYVFNIDQTNLKEARPDMYKELCEKYANGTKPENMQGDDFCFEPVDRMIKQNLWICPIINKEGDDCYYSISFNEIVTPEKKQFKNAESFYSNLFHEMAHSTGCKEQLDRLKPASFGSNEYAREELVAEMTAALTATRYGMEKNIKEDSAAYLKSWLKSLKESPNFIKTVLADVKKAAAMLTQCIDSVPVEKKEEKKQETAKVAEDSEVSLTPMTKQFLDLKKKHPDALLLFRCGDFYETYMEDAKKASGCLGITLTESSKSKDPDGKPMAMAGFPYHALDTYLPKLIRAGHRVAICDQIEEPAKTAKRVKAKKEKTLFAE